jgi:hypothetical protein
VVVAGWLLVSHLRDIQFAHREARIEQESNNERQQIALARRDWAEPLL